MSRSMRRSEFVARWLARCSRVWRVAIRSARLAVGVPDYDTYVAHMGRRHPDLPLMDRRAFHRERMEARYGRGRSRCC